jgi:hypothetical protein
MIRQPKVLEDGDLITAGDTELEFKFEEEQA